MHSPLPTRDTFWRNGRMVWSTKIPTLNAFLQLTKKMHYNLHNGFVQQQHAPMDAHNSVHNSKEWCTTTCTTARCTAAEEEGNVRFPIQTGQLDPTTMWSCHLTLTKSILSTQIDDLERRIDMKEESMKLFSLCYEFGQSHHMKETRYPFCSRCGTIHRTYTFTMQQRWMALPRSIVN